MLNGESEMMPVNTPNRTIIGNDQNSLHTKTEESITHSARTNTITETAPNNMHHCLSRLVHVKNSPVFLKSVRKSQPDGVCVYKNTGANLDNIRTMRVGGRKREHPIDVLKEQDSSTVEGAKKLLAEHRFADNSILDAYKFGLKMEQTGKIPHGTEQFKKRELSQGKRRESIETITVINPNIPKEIDISGHGHKVKFHLGEKLGEGTNAEVFLDADDSQYVIKRYFKDNSAKKQALKEANAFKRYYGEDSAHVFFDDQHGSYLRMYKVPGKTLDSLPLRSLPEDSQQRYFDMLERLNHVGIMHGDLYPENILWDDNSKTFFPIDIDDIKEEFFTSNFDRKAELNERNEKDLDLILSEIEQKRVVTQI